MVKDGTASAEEIFRLAVVAHQQSRLDEAQILYRQALLAQPNHVHALHLCGVLALQRNRAEQALELIGKALLIDPSNAIAHMNYATAQQGLRQFSAAIQSYDKSLALMPNCAEAWYNRGNALREGGDPAAALDSYDRAISLKPGYADAYLNSGLALSTLGRFEAAILRFDKAIALDPNSPDAHYNRGNELRGVGRYEAAIASYDKAIALQPGFADALLNRGSALVGLRRYNDALASYDKAVALRPGHAQAYFNRAGALQYLGRLEAAVTNYDTAIALQPGVAEYHANRGRALREMKRYEEAIESYGEAARLDSGSVALLALQRHIKMQICDWGDLDADIEAIEAGIARGADAPNPFYIMALCDSAAVQRAVATSWVRAECPPSASPPAVSMRARSDRIHIGYFSADYHEHATAYLMAQLLELHDRSRFKISAFSFGPESHGPMRRRLKAACDAFIDVRDRSDDDVAALARNSHVDIAVDLKGFTQDHRVGIFARRAAALQVNFLGAPGTLGAPFMDYLIADRVIVPPEMRRHYAESIIYLPDSYQVNDSKRVIAEKNLTRAELGLPPTGFVFCCFNNTYKILPAIFQRWLHMLARVPNSALWLLGDNPGATANLRRAAAQRQIDPNRLVFGPRLELAEHLARHRAADLFVDTLPCNAHTTASDALWAGLPVVTCLGQAFAGRVAGSLLEAIGLPELITANLDDYEELAVDLATNPARLTAIRERLALQRMHAPLFDTPRYARHIEAAFTDMYERYHSGLPPADLVISPRIGVEAAARSIEPRSHHA